MSVLQDKTFIQPICNFIRELGIEITEGETDPASFLPAIEIREGTLVVDFAQLNYPGDLLHEAGHIAVTTARERPYLSGNITDEHPEKKGDEMAVLLWTYAACRKIGIPPEVVFHPEGYKGESQWIINNFNQGKYVGLPLLVWMGLAHHTSHPAGFPTMIRWLRE